MLYLLILAFLVLAICSAVIAFLALGKFDPNNPKTVSFLVAQNQKDLKIFRVAVLGGTLSLVIAVFFFIVPKIEYSLFFAISYGVVYSSAFLLSLIPDKNGTDIFTYSLHNLFAWIVGLGVVLTTILLSLVLDGTVARIEAALVVLMLFLSFAAIYNRKGFVFYELTFILASYVSVFVAVIALY